MKKNFVLAILSITFLSFFSCTKTIEHPQESQAYSVVFNIASNGWEEQYNGSVYHYYQDLDMPDIDSYILANGAVVTYMSFDGGKTYSALPQVYEGISYNADHSNGWVTLEMHALNGNRLQNFPNSQAKVVIIDATPL